jgi:UDP-N-acetylglucosamine 2-epimerase
MSRIFVNKLETDSKRPIYSVLKAHRRENSIQNNITEFVIDINKLIELTKEKLRETIDLNRNDENKIERYIAKNNISKILISLQHQNIVKSIEKNNLIINNKALNSILELYDKNSIPLENISYDYFI